MDFVVIAVGIFSSARFGGAEVILVELAKRLIRQGNHVTILTSKSGETLFRGQGLDADFWTITEGAGVWEASLARRIVALPTRMLKAGMVLRKKNLGERPIIFAASGSFSDIFPMLFIRDKRIKRVLPFYHIIANPLKGWRAAFGNKVKTLSPGQILAYLDNRLSLLCLKYACDLVFCLSYLQYFLIEKGIPYEKVVGFDPGIDWDIINKTSAVEKIYDACWMGGYYPIRGCDDLIPLWELVCRRKNEAKLAIMGSASRKLEPLVKEKRLEKNIKILGFVDDKTKFRTMRESRIFLYPSYFESGALSISEAMACGLPVIAYDLSVYRGIYPKGMVKVAIGNHKAFAKETLRLLSENEARQKLSAEAQGLASRWSWDKVCDNFLSGLVCLKGD